MIGEAPWLAVFNPDTNKMITAKENTQLLDDLLYVHIAASSKQSIVKARKQFRDVRGVAYPVTEQALQVNLTPHTENRTVPPPDLVPGAGSIEIETEFAVVASETEET